MVYGLQGFPDKGSEYMKIEKVNENQIRCTLTREDLAERQIKLSELAYGSEKAKLLFRDMIQQAAYEFGFEADDIPLMIEAIPLSADTIILIITKVEYPEELDTRFSKFSEPDSEDFYGDMMDGGGLSTLSESADDILGLFQWQTEEEKAQESQEEQGLSGKKEAGGPKDQIPMNVLADITKLFVFHNLAEITRLAHILKGFYDGRNDLYQNKKNRQFYLLVSKSSQSPESFNKVCNILSEYAYQQTYTPAIAAFFKEHYQLILKNRALQTLAEL